MADQDRKTSDSLVKSMAAQPFAFDFFHAVRSLEAEYRNRPRVGGSIRLDQDFLRFGQEPSLAFAPSTLKSVEQVGGFIRIFVNFLGLFGPNGPLPQHLTDFARDRERNARDPTFARFADIFHHRMLSFFYRAWAANQKTVDFDRPEESRYADFFGSFFGIGSPALRNRDSVPDFAKIHFTGRLSALAPNAEGLQSILQDFFGVPTRIEEFSPYWMAIPDENQCRLGESPDTGSLGINAIAGSRKFEPQLKFQIRMGPMELSDLYRLVPSGESFKQMKDWVLNYLNQELFWDLKCILRAAAVPAISLGQSGMLGWTTWLKSQPFKRDTVDPVFDPDILV
jgi:type VI secretion system protein ImpH